MTTGISQGNWFQKIGGWGRFGIVVTGIGVFVIVGSFFFWTMCLNYVDNYELGYTFDARTGKIEILKRAGYVVTAPFVVSVHTIDLRPMQVCINANSRVLNCKLVQFDPKGVELFLSWHGRSDYTGDALHPILMSYAYDGSGKSYPFLRIIRELKPEDIGEPAQ